MLPMIAAYGILILGTYLLWFKVKKTILRANEIELERVKAQSVIEAMQRTSKLLAQHITENNNAILLWLHDKKERNQQILSVVENSCNNISMALQALNKFSYVIPYDRSSPEDSPAELEKKLEMELKSTTYS
jgi:hypothetical protein